MYKKQKKNIFADFSFIRLVDTLSRMRPYKSMVAMVFFVYPLAVVAVWQSTSVPVASAYECTQVALDDVNQALLTKEERIALLDDSLHVSIDSYSTCVSAAAKNMSGGAADQGDSDAGSGQTALAESGGDAAGSLPEKADAAGTNGNDEIPLMQNRIGASISGKSSPTSVRGIIAPKDNDRIICKLLYQEITKTQDPDMLKGLRQQYNNYACG
jgi:hypothetical protein